MEDDDNANAEVGEYAHNFLEVVLRQFWEGCFGRRRTTTKMTVTSSDDEHEVAVMTLLMFKTLCEGEPALLSSMAQPEAPIIGDDRGEGGRGGSVADERITDGARTSATTERGICRDGNDYE